ncbi:MAG: bifunctional folylpolyglutamate synthase/dihydrofolate synthase [Prevotella sp.]|nr:bifunctional folylpolyglutamate synthase/dihydrofolate synthase [Prevotella sp.]MBQ1801241.1 bifunctional folylpolyglutamate synthase/dihydrofolate synthase [Prevotella sp.]
MNYQETIQYLYNSTPVFEHVGASAYKEGLSNSWALDEHFNHPHTKFKTIHVAGTNGKGSCSHTIAAILQAEGYRVGLFTSPHLVDFRERIKVNGDCISQEYVMDFVENERSFFEPLHPSFFELTTAMAFKYFADSHVDIAVIEVGLGGRLDCTNIITPILSVITNISFDHTQFLGDTLEKIAMEKAGIIKRDIPIVIGETTPETRNVFIQKAKEMNAPIFFAEEYNNPIANELDFELKGSYQLKNKQTILCAVNHLPLSISPSSIKEGLSHVVELTGLMGRWQTIRERPTVICDTGHNVGGWQYLSQQIKSQPCKNLHIVFGMVDDKDIDTVMNMLPTKATYYFTQAQTKRAIPANIVKEKGKEHHLKGYVFPQVADAYKAALHHANEDDFIFVGGSSYIVADFLTLYDNMS